MFIELWNSCCCMHNLKSKKKTTQWARIVKTFCQTPKHFWFLFFFLLQIPCQSLFVLDFPLYIWNNSISSACHVYFQWFSGAVFYCFVYWFARCSAALLEHWRHHCTINRRSSTQIHRLGNWILKSRISLVKTRLTSTYFSIKMNQENTAKQQQLGTELKFNPRTLNTKFHYYKRFWEGADINYNTCNSSTLTPVCWSGICGLKCFFQAGKGTEHASSVVAVPCVPGVRRASRPGRWSCQEPAPIQSCFQATLGAGAEPADTGTPQLMESPAAALWAPGK